jgi:hypothetical protein
MRHFASRIEYKMVAAPVGSQAPRIVAVRAGQRLAWPFLRTFHQLSRLCGGRFRVLDLQPDLRGSHPAWVFFL